MIYLLENNCNFNPNSHLDKKWHIPKNPKSKFHKQPEFKVKIRQSTDMRHTPVQENQKHDVYLRLFSSSQMNFIMKSSS